MKAAVVISAVILLIGGIFGNYLRYSSHMPDRPPAFETIPYQLEDYLGQERRFSELSYEVLRADTTTFR